MALCAGAILAYPATWGARFRAAALGLLAITLLNVVRIGHLSLVAADNSLFQLLHIYVWPGILILATAAYVFAWMNREGRTAPAGGSARRIALSAAGRRFAVLAVVLVVVYFATAPLFYESSFVDVVARWIAATGGAILVAAGTTVTVAGPVIRTAHGGFRVTQECIFTPLIPLYIAGALSAPLVPWRRFAALAATPLLFFAVGVSRLLVLAVPATVIGSYSTAIHAFSQTLVALIRWRWRPSTPPGRAPGHGRRVSASLSPSPGRRSGVCSSAVPRATRPVRGALGRHGGPHPAGATPALGLGALAVTQAVLTIPVGELAHHYGFDPHAGLIRGWALVLPTAAVWWPRPPGPVHDRRHARLAPRDPAGGLTLRGAGLRSHLVGGSGVNDQDRHPATARGLRR